MRLLSPTLFAVVVAAASGPVKSAEVDPATNSRVEKQVVAKLVTAIGDLGNGRIDAALDKFQAMLGRKFQKTTGPFGQDERDVWRKMFALFVKTPPKFESVDLIAVQPISTQSFRISMVGNGERGPVMFQFRAFEYHGKFQLANVHFDSNWGRMETLVETEPEAFVPGAEVLRDYYTRRNQLQAAQQWQRRLSEHRGLCSPRRLGSIRSRDGRVFLSA